MSSLGEIILWLLWELIFAFVFYVTGAVILRLVSFGRIKKPIFSLSEFKVLSKDPERSFAVVYLTGGCFYAVLIALLIWQN